MPNGPWCRADHYRQLVDESVALAKAATSNEIRAEHYAAAEYYLHLAGFEANLAGRTASTAKPHCESVGVKQPRPESKVCLK
jgi:hypothetical protein